MSKIICDICGTSYPETADQCPICGCVRPGDVQRVTNEVKSNGKVSTGYTHVRGGHFSKTNVKKRTGGQAAGAGTSKKTAAENAKNPEEKTNRGLVITAAVLLLAILGVVIYMAIRVFGPISDPNHGNNPTNTTGQSADLSCVAITLDADAITLGLDEARLLHVTLEPKNTSDFISFRSEDTTVATINEVGKITAVGEGTTTIVVTCGKITKTCTVTCQQPTESTAPTVEPTDATESPTVAVEELRLNRTDMTLAYKGETWVLYDGSIAKNLITWTSEDESVVTITDGKVVAVGTSAEGVWVHAEYEGQKASCLVRCVFKESSGVEGSGGVSEDGGSSGTALKTGKIANVSVDANIRKGPGTTFDMNGTIALGKEVTIYETTYAEGMNWAKIGTDMWVSMDYIQVN